MGEKGWYQGPDDDTPQDKEAPGLCFTAIPAAGILIALLLRLRRPAK